MGHIMDNTWTCLLLTVVIFEILFVTSAQSYSYNTSSALTSITVNWQYSQCQQQGDCNYTLNYSKVGSADPALTRTITEYKADQQDTLPNLLPETQYDIELKVVFRNGTESSVFTTKTATLPKKVVLLTSPSRTTRSVYVTWSPQNDSSVTTYRLLIYDATVGGAQITRIDDLAQAQYNITPATPGHQYAVHVYALKHGQAAEEVSLYVTAIPLQPVAVTVIATDTEWLNVSWTAPSEGVVSSYKVEYRRNDSPTFVSAVCPDLSKLYCEINAAGSDLPGQQYVVQVKSTTDGVDSAASLQNGNTKPLPVSVNDISLTTFTTSSVIISWLKPQATVFDNYKLLFTSGGINVIEADKTSDENTLVFSIPASNVAGNGYNVSLTTVSGVEESASSTKSFNFNPVKPSDLQNQEADIGTDFIQIHWSPSDKGIFDSYKLEVSQGQSLIKTVPLSMDLTSYNMSTSVDPGTVYNFTLKAKSGLQLSEALTKEFHSRPGPITFVNPMVTLTSAEIYWSAPSKGGVDNYMVELSSVGTILKTETQTTENKTFSVLNTGTSYTVRVWAQLRSSNSEPVSIDIRTVPATPATFVANEITNTSISVSWTAPSEAGMFDTYTLTIDDGSSPLSLLKNVTMYVFDNLLPAKNYSVQINTVSGGKSSAVLTRVIVTRPNSPTAITITSVSENTFTVNWSPPQGTYSDHFLQVEYSPSGSLETFTIPHSTGPYSQTVSNRKAGGHYILTLWSRYYGVTSTALTTSVTTPPSQPWNILVDHVGKTSVDFHWLVLDNVDFDHFDLTITKIQTDEVIVNETIPAITTSRSVQNLEPGQIYKIRIFLISRGVKSLQSRTHDVTTLPNSVSSLEKGLVNETAIQVTWTEPIGSVFDRYELSINPVETGVTSPMIIPRSQAPLEHMFSPLKPGQSYMLNITTVTSSGIKSNPYSRTITAKPRKVESLAAMATSEVNISVSWTVNADSTQDKFRVMYYKENEAPQVREVTFSDTVSSYETTLTGLLSGQQYTVSVAASSNGQENVADNVNAVTAPLPVKGLGAKAIAASTTLSWENEVTSKQDSYIVEYRPTLRNPNAAWSFKMTSTTSLTLTDLFPGEHYNIKVKAVSMGVNGSSKVTDVTTLPLSPSLSFNMISNTDSLTVKWTYDKNDTYLMSWLIQYREDGAVAWTETSVTVVEGTLQYEKVLSPLTAGQNYSVQVKALTFMNVSSSYASIQGTVRPLCDSVLTEDVDRTTNDSVVVTYTENSQGVFGHYLFCLMYDSTCVGGIVSQNKGLADKSLTFSTDVIAGRQYKVQVFTISGEQQSAPIDLSVTTVPNHVDAKVHVESSQKLTVQWAHPSGGVSNYEVNCTECKTSRLVSNGQQTVSLLYDGLQAFTNYTFKIVTISGEKRSSAMTVMARTLQAPPSAVRNLGYTDLEPTKLRLAWLPPESPNGRLIEYLINYSGVKQGHTPVTGSYRIDHYPHTTNPSLNLITQEYIITNLRAGFNYTFRVSAKTISYGPNDSISVKIPTAAPPLLPSVTPLLPSVSADRPNDTHSRTVSLKVNLKKAFSETNGEILGYTVIVAEVTESNTIPASTTGAYIDSYQQVKNQDVWGPYQVIPQCQLFDIISNCETKSGMASRRKRNARLRMARSTSDATDFIVGAVDCPDSTSSSEYCNGRLRPGKLYRIKLRAYTEGNFFTDTEYSDVFQTDHDFTGVIIGVVVALVVVLVVVLAGLWVMRRRGMFGGNKMKGSEPDTNTTMSPVPGSRLSSRKNKRDRSRPVKLPKFAEHVESLAKDGEFGYAEEYEDLKQVGRSQPYSASEIPENRPKNRFTNIYPYDHSRVKLLPLDDVDGSDYINANYIPGYNGKREFIVCQGPMQSTEEDFWRMVWEQNVRVIVMLTLCVEKMKEKCHHYWPEDKDAANYGDVIVQIMSEVSWGSYNITEFKVMKGDMVRVIRHYHFLKWPDFRHLEPEDIIGFIRAVRSQLDSQKSPGPVLVHCSAGVGRSGTFIAIDRSLQHIKEHDYLDIFGTVYEMRMNRVYMVQTEKQYVSIHKCLLHVIEGSETEAEMVQGVDNKAFVDDDQNPYQNYINGTGTSQVNVQLSEL